MAYLTHKKAIDKVAAEMGLDKKDVAEIINGIFLKSGIENHMVHPNVIVLPRLGTLVPDMRSHRWLIAREKKTRWIFDNRNRQKNDKKKKKERINKFTNQT